jgi:restriction endonuclease S subunit
MKKKNDCAQTSAVQTVVEKVVAAIKNTHESPELVLSTDEPTRKIELQKFYENIHHILWTSASLSPEKALDAMTFFFAYRLIENQADELSLPSECRWSHVMTFKNNANELDIIVKKGNSSFLKNVRTKPFFKQHEIKRAEIVQQIMCLINRIPTSALSEGDTLGDIFEHMLSRGMSTMSDEGQYFTNRGICHLAFELAYKIKKSVYRSDGSLCTFADWFCGTGGFPAEFVKGVAQKSIEEEKLIDWKKCSGSVYCQDMNGSSVTTTLLNMLILTGVPFSSKNIRSGNSFTDPIVFGDAAPHKDIKIDYCFMNPPYGGDKTKGKDYKFAYSKKVKDEAGKNVTRYVVNSEIQSIGIEDDDKVSAGVQLAMATLSTDGGVCSIVLPQGFFFGALKKCVELRKKIAEEYKIWYVVDIASGSFINTGTKTSMMVFQKGVGATEKVSFIGLDETVLVEATLEELRGKNYSLNYKQYLPQSAVEVEGFEMVKLGDLVTISTGKNKTPDDKKGTMYPYYGTSGITGYTDHFLEDGEYILTARNGTIGNTFLIKGKSYPSDHMFTLRTNEKCLLKYVYYWMMSNKKVIENLANVTTIPGITRASLVEIQIPLPSLERQQEIIEAIDGWAGLAQQEEVALKILEKQVMFQVKEMGRGQTRVKLGELLKPVKGKRYPVSEGSDVGSYPLLRSSKDGKVKWMDEYTYEGPYITAGNGGEANFRLVEKFNASTHTLVYDVTDKAIMQFVYYIIQSMNNTINEVCFQGTGLKNLNTSLFMDVEIPLPPLTEQQTLQSDFDEIRHKHAKIVMYKAKAQEAISRLIPGAT